MNQRLASLGKYGFWFALVLYTLAVLVFYVGEFSTPPPSTAVYLNTEYKWAVDFAEGRSIYTSEKNFIEGHSNAYMPLYFVVTGGVMRLSGSTDAVVGKLVSTFAALSGALLIYLIGVKFTGRKLASVVPGLLFLLYPVVVNFSASQVKIDILGLFFTILGVYFVLGRHYLLAVVPMVLAFFTKQFYIALPISVGLWLLFKDRSTLVRFVGLYSVFVATGFGVGQLVTEGRFFRHVVLFLFAPEFSTQEVSRTLAGTLICFGYLTPVLILAIYGMWRMKYLGFLTLYLVVASVLLVFMIGKVGSGTNYTFESLVACCCLATLVFKKRLKDEVMYSSGSSDCDSYYGGFVGAS